ncbi:MAG: alkyl hydroperoxide reductase, partial [Jatrophihabitans sp.]
VHPAVGGGLFVFAHVEAPPGGARLQHPLGVAVDGGDVLIADTYNGALRRYRDGRVDTLAVGLAEPSGVLRLGGDLLVVESAAHRVTRPAVAPQVVGGEAQHTERPPSELRPGAVTVEVVFDVPPGRKLDDSFGPPIRVDITSSPSALIVEGAGESTALARRLVLADGVTTGVLHITAQVASCDAGDEHPACYLARQDWGVPVRIGPDGPAELRLMLNG